MNPAALKVNLDDLKPGGILIVNIDAFKDTDLRKARLTTNPLEDGSLDGYRVFPVELTRLTRAALREVGTRREEHGPLQELLRAGNDVLALQPARWTSPSAGSRRSSRAKPELVEANQLALKAGYAYCEATEVFQVRYEVPPAKLEPGHLPQHLRQPGAGARLRRRGRRRRADRCSRAPTRSRRPPTSCTSSRRYKNFGVVTFQAEDEIAAIGAAIGASFAGALGVTSTSGPGMALKSEALGLAIMVELPLVVVDVQRGGPSTGLPTKTEQADLLPGALRPHSARRRAGPRRATRRPTASTSPRGLPPRA